MCTGTCVCVCLPLSLSLLLVYLALSSWESMAEDGQEPSGPALGLAALPAALAVLPAPTGPCRSSRAGHWDIPIYPPPKNTPGGPRWWHTLLKAVCPSILPRMAVGSLDAFLQPGLHPGPMGSLESPPGLPTPRGSERTLQPSTVISHQACPGGRSGGRSRKGQGRKPGLDVSSPAARCGDLGRHGSVCFPVQQERRADEAGARKAER